MRRRVPAVVRGEGGRGGTPALSSERLAWWNQLITVGFSLLPGGSQHGPSLGPRLNCSVCTSDDALGSTLKKCLGRSHSPIDLRERCEKGAKSVRKILPVF